MKCVCKIAVIFFWLVLTSHLLFAQSLHNEYIANLNYRNINFTRTDSIKGITWISDKATYDEKKHIYYFVGDQVAGDPLKLVGVDVLTGSTVTSPFVASNISGSQVLGLEYDNVTDTLYSLIYIAGVANFAWIDPITGNATIKNTYPAMQGYIGASSTYDENHHRYIFAGYVTAPEQVVSIDAQTGVLLNVATMSKSFNVSFMEYSNKRNTLYGLVYYNNAQEVDSIELTTGIQHQLAVLPLFSTQQSGMCCIDEDSGRYIFVAMTVPPYDGTLYAVDCATGAIVYQPPIPYMNATVNTGENLIDFCWDRIRKTIFALNWGPVRATPPSCIATAGTITANHYTICPGTSVRLSASGVQGAIHWQSNETGSYASIPGASNVNYSSVYTTPEIINFRLVADSGSCSDTSLAVTVTVVSAPTATYTYSDTGKTVEFNSAGSVGATSYQWDFGDGSAFNNTPNPTHTYAHDSVYYVCLTSYNNSGCSYTICKDVTIHTATGVQNLTAETGFNLYPNPGSGQYTLQLKGMANNITAQVNVVNVLGERIITQQVSAAALKAGVPITLNKSLPAGQYFINVTTESSSCTGKIILVK